MNLMRFPGRGGVVGLVYLAVMMAGCSDDSTGPVVEEPFDPTFAVEVVQDVSGALEATELDPMMNNIGFTLSQAAPAAGPASSQSTTMPGTGGTYVFDESELRWEVDPERAGAPEDGVRFIWYAMDGNANTPIRPLQERGWVDLRLEESGENASIMYVTFVRLMDGVATEVIDYSITYQGDAESGSFSLVAEGTADGIAFDAERWFTYGEQEGVYEALVSVGGEAGLLSASLESRFDPVTLEDTGDVRFVGSVLTAGHYLLVEADVDPEAGTLGGMVEADDEGVLELLGTVAAPVFELPTGGSPSAGVQADMEKVWNALWGLLGEGVTLLVVLENLYH